jgi:hypothetical protein
MSQHTDMKSATQTYESFLTFAKWGTIVSLAIGALVILLISS